MTPSYPAMNMDLTVWYRGSSASSGLSADRYNILLARLWYRRKVVFPTPRGPVRSRARGSAIVFLCQEHNIENATKITMNYCKCSYFRNKLIIILGFGLIRMPIPHTTISASVGIYAGLVDAIDETAKPFYVKYGLYILRSPSVDLISALGNNQDRARLRSPICSQKRTLLYAEYLAGDLRLIRKLELVAGNTAVLVCSIRGAAVCT
jgi:hypothetical protein